MASTLHSAVLRSHLASTLVGALLVSAAVVCQAEERRNWFDVPFDQAISGLLACPRPEGPLIAEAEMKLQAHARIERGTSCWLQKKCEDSNAYRRDAEVQSRVLQALRDDRRFASASVWITTERRFVTVQGCMRAAAQRRALLQRVRATPGVELVTDQLQVGTRAPPRWKVDPAWQR